jgi:hypothetical protein
MFLFTTVFVQIILFPLKTFDSCDLTGHFDVLFEIGEIDFQRLVRDVRDVLRAEYVGNALVLFVQFSHDDTSSLPNKLSRQIVKIHCIHIKVGLRRQVGIISFTPLSRTWHTCRVEPCRLGCSPITRMGCTIIGEYWMTPRQGLTLGQGESL